MGRDVQGLLAKAQAAHGANNNETGLLYPYDVRSFQFLYDLAPTGKAMLCCFVLLCRASFFCY